MVGVTMAHDRLHGAAQAMPNKRVLIMMHENITINHYAGNNRSCLVSNCLFRVGGAACIMSNRYALSGCQHALPACFRAAVSSLPYVIFICCKSCWTLPMREDSSHLST